MLKRTAALVTAGVILAAIHAGDAQAHYYMVGGKWVFHTLGVDDLIITNVANPTAHPAMAVFTAMVQEYQFLCRNPADNAASLTVMLRTATVGAVAPITAGNWNKRRGTVTLTGIDLPTGTLAVDPNDCINPNWIPQPLTVLVTKFEGKIVTFVCDTDGNNCAPETEVIDHCTLDGYTAGNLPPSGTLYTCPAELRESFHFK